MEIERLDKNNKKNILNKISIKSSAEEISSAIVEAISSEQWVKISDGHSQEVRSEIIQYCTALLNYKGSELNAKALKNATWVLAIFTVVLVTSTMFQLICYFSTK